MTSAADALQRLRDGNMRFVDGTNDVANTLGQARRAELVDGQDPFAVILACSDSRVPVELVFDQGLGDLFVIRVAGNIVAPSQIGSIEYAASQLGTQLVVILGHSNCGAVQATLAQLADEQGQLSPNLRAIVDLIRPAIEPLLARESDVSLHDAVVANVHQSVEQLVQDSEIIRGLIQNGSLRVVGAEYSIESGEVEFFD